jgi:hypothetical protein
MAPLPRRLHVAVGTSLLGASLTLGCTDKDVRVNEGPEQKVNAPPNTNPGPEPEPKPEPKPEPEPKRVNTRPDPVVPPPEIEPLHVNEGPMPVPEPAPEQAPPDTKVNPGPNTPPATP